MLIHLVSRFGLQCKLAHIYYNLAEERKHGLDSELAQYCEYRWM
ncbi:hypothetical protein ACVD4U_003972 [Vibrio vulnificus]